MFAKKQKFELPHPHIFNRVHICDVSPNLNFNIKKNIALMIFEACEIETQKRNGGFY